DAHSTNTKVEALSRAKKKGVGGHNSHSRSSYSSKEERHERHRRERGCEGRYKREEDRSDNLDLGKCKIPQLGDSKLEELKVEQLITSLGIQGRKGVSLVVVALEDYALVWWTSLMDDIRRGIEEPCES
ncbi:hypothetical protein CR513_21458, partial [Mucuna pruriens]